MLLNNEEKITLNDIEINDNYIKIKKYVYLLNTLKRFYTNADTNCEKVKLYNLNMKNEATDKTEFYLIGEREELNEAWGRFLKIFVEEQ